MQGVRGDYPPGGEVQEGQRPSCPPEASTLC